MKYRTFALALALGFAAHASKIIGNGGNVVVCMNRNISPSIVHVARPVMLLDFYEAELLHDLTIQDPGGQTYQEKVANIMAKFRIKFPDLAKALDVELNNFEIHNRKLAGVELESTVDSFHSALPLGCSIQQVAIQIPSTLPRFPRDPWFEVSQDLWDQLDELNKAGLVIHEALYRIGARNGAEHSRGVRYVVGLMFSTQMESISDEDWISGFTESRVRNYEMDGVTIPLFSGNFVACDMEPGSSTCTGPTGDLKVAKLSYKDGNLVEINYNSPERIFLKENHVMAQLEVKNLRFDHGDFETTLIAQGILELSATSDFGYNAGPVRLVFDGKINPKQETCSGSISPSYGTTTSVNEKQTIKDEGFQQILSTLISAPNK